MGVLEKVPFQPRPEAGEGVRTIVWAKGVLGSSKL